MAPELKVLIAFCIKNHVMCELTFAQKADMGSNSFEHIWEMLVRSFPGVASPGSFGRRGWFCQDCIL